MNNRSLYCLKNALAIIIAIIGINVTAQPVKINIQIKGVSDTSVILAHYLNKSIYPDDTVALNAKGQGVIKKTKNYHQGMYVIYLPTGSHFEFLMGNDQQFTMITDTSDFISNMKIEGSDDNAIFFDFQKYMASKRDEIKVAHEMSKSQDENEKQKSREKLKQLAEERKEKIRKIAASNPDLFVSTLLKSTLDVELPDMSKKEKDGKIDSLAQYQYYKNHYFDNFDPSDGRLLYTPLYEDKVMYYLEKVVFQIPDTLIREIDVLMQGARKDSTLFRYLLITLFNHYGNSNIMGFDAIQVHLADEYYLKESWWNDEKFLTELRERVEILKPLILGKVAPDIELLFVPSDHFRVAENDSALKRYPHVGQLMKLSEVQAEFVVIVFWEAGCSHCKTAIPKMYSLYREQLAPMGVKVICVSTLFGEEGKIKWIDFVNKYQLYDWMNAWNPYDYKYKLVYDIRTTPQIFILDKNKKIIGKRLGPEQVPDLIKAYKRDIN